MTADRGGRRALALETEGLSLAALFENGRLEDLFVQPSEDASASDAPEAGEIYAAKVDRVIDGRSGAKRAAFLQAGAGLSLYLADAEGVSPGERLIVEVTREPEGRKAARASRRLTLSGCWLAHTPGAPGVNVSRKIADAEAREALKMAVEPFAATGGFVIRTRATQAPIDALADEAKALSDIAARILDEPLDPPRRIRSAPSPRERARAAWGLEPGDLASEPGLAARALETVETFSETRIALEGGAGAWMALERCEALIAVDINTGEAGDSLSANLAALREIPRQLRLRGLGGMLAVDCAPMAKGDRARVSKALEQAADAGLDVAGFGPIGLLEAIRRRDRAVLEPMRHEVLTALGRIADRDA